MDTAELSSKTVITKLVQSHQHQSLKSFLHLTISLVKKIALFDLQFLKKLNIFLSLLVIYISSVITCFCLQTIFLLNLLFFSDLKNYLGVLLYYGIFQQSSFYFLTEIFLVIAQVFNFVQLNMIVFQVYQVFI